MGRFRSLLWLVVLMGFIAPSFGAASFAHATQPAEAAALADCPDHAPPPNPCPDKDTAKHAAAECCPLMAASFALLPPAAGLDRVAAFDAPTPTRAPSLAGLTFTKDPPPPRV